PRAGTRHEERLWADFKAAGDVLYAAKSEIDARNDAELAVNLKLKEQILAEAEPVRMQADHEKARAALTVIQRRWDKIGRVPRQSERKIEGRLRAIEETVRTREHEYWQLN